MASLMLGEISKNSSARNPFSETRVGTKCALESGLQDFINVMWYIYSISVILTLEHESKSPGRLVKAQMAGPYLRVF